jgi:hypothetical protein
MPELIDHVSATRAFVIGPIGDKDAADGTDQRTAFEEGIQIFEEVIAPACIGFGLEPMRADMISISGEIPEQIFRQLRDCPVVIADLTGANPNVMYELGLRHTTGKVTIQIGEKGRLPFDVAAIRTIMFRRSESGLVQARKDLAKALAANLDSGGDPVTATRIWFESLSVENDLRKDMAIGEDQRDEPDDSPGFLELMADTESGIQSLGQTLSAATVIFEEIGRIYREGGKSAEQADSHGGGAAAKLVIAEQIASKVNAQAAKFEVVSGELAQTVDRIEPGLRYILDQLANNPAQLREVPEFPEQVRSLCVASRGSIDVTLAVKQNALDLGQASRSLKRAAQRLAPSFNRIAESSARVAGWESLLERFQDISGSESAFS